MSASAQPESRVEALLAEQLRWVRAAAMPQVRQIIDIALTSKQRREAFELCDGKTTITAIAKKVNASQPTVSRWAIAWQQLGIAYETDGGVRHLVSLKALGLSLEVTGGSEEKAS
jgi:hypothetical protein